MSPQAAETLAVKIAQCWPRSAPVDVWLEDIADLDEGAAGTAFVRLRRESEHAPSIAKFRATALSLRTTDGGTERRPPCKSCDDTGWLEAPDVSPADCYRHDGTPLTYTQVKPCVCREGRAREASTVWQTRGGAA